MLIGYARVSTLDQHLDLQEDALKRAGCEKVFVDRVSSTVAERLGLAKVKELLRKGDTLIVWRLDRLGRSLKDLIEWVTYLAQEDGFATSPLIGRSWYFNQAYTGLQPGCSFPHCRLCWFNITFMLRVFSAPFV